MVRHHLPLFVVVHKAGKLDIEVVLEEAHHGKVMGFVRLVCLVEARLDHNLTVVVAVLVWAEVALDP